MRGVCYAHAWTGGGARGYGSDSSARSLKALKALGVSWVSLTPFGYQRKLTDDEVHLATRFPGGETDARLATDTQRAHALGMKVMLKPHIWVHTSEWCGHIDPGSKKGWERWMRSYERFILHYARLATRTKADALVVGTELSTAVLRVPEAWPRVIAAVRREYAGPITYAANWNVADRVTFWDQLDFIGIQAYQPLVARKGATAAELGRGARAMADAIGALAKRTGKPVVLTEVGYKSVLDPAIHPNGWPEHDRNPSYSEVDQAAAYRAVYEAFEGRSWYRGLFWWKWFSDPAAVEEGPLGFTPKAPARELLRQRWAR